MRDLYRCLDEYPPEFLQAIFGVWQVPLPEGEPRQMAVHLAEAMLAPNALERTLQRLTPAAQSALAEIVKEGGVAPGHRLFVKYGNIRRLGPAAMEREQPWARPEGVLEELYYKGIIYRAYAAVVGGYYGEVYFIPRDLLEPLQKLESEVAELDVQEAPAPTRIEHDGSALAEDLLAFLVRIRQGRISASGPERTRKGSSALDELDLGPRLVGENHPERLALLRRLLWRLDLLQDHKSILRPSPRARKWLHLPDHRRARSIYLAWRDDPHWDELDRVPSLGFDDRRRQTNPIVARSNLLQVLAKCPAGRWLLLSSFLDALKHRRPDFLRPDGDYDSWYVRDAGTGEYLSGFASWEKVEGALATHTITSSLRWLGVVDLGYGGEDADPTAFRITDQGSSLLPAESQAPQAEATSLSFPPATVGGDLTITMSVTNSMYERYQLERFAEWEAQDSVATYRITADSVWKAYNAGVKTAQIARFLKRIAKDQVPPAVSRTLQAWGGRFGRATLRKMVLLRTGDEPTMTQIRSHPKVGGLLGETLSPTICLVDEENAEELLQQLKDMGIWPRLID